jgi:hypothetical protein
VLVRLAGGLRVRDRAGEPGRPDDADASDTSAHGDQHEIALP